MAAAMIVKTVLRGMSFLLLSGFSHDLSRKTIQARKVCHYNMAFAHI